MSIESKLAKLQQDLDKLSQEHCQCVTQMMSITADIATLRAELQALLNL